MPLVDPKDCACPAHDAYECAYLKFGAANPTEEGPCECACHQRDPDDYWDEAEDF